MSTPDNGTVTARGGVKTLAIRLEPQLHAQLSLVAQLRTRTITDEIRTAIEAHIALAVTDPGFAAQVTEVLADIEREAEARRAAITNLIGRSSNEATPPADAPPSDTPPPTRGKNQRGATSTG